MGRDRGLIAAGAALILLGCGIAIAVPAGLGWDFANFYDAGHKARVGQIADLYDPAAQIEGQPPQGSMTFWSVPLASVLLAPLAWLPPEAALVAFKVQNTLAILVALWLLHGLAVRFVADEPEARTRYTLLFVWLALLFQPLWTAFRVGGQTTPTILLLLSVGLWAHTRARWGLSALAWVLAVVLKPAFVLGLGFLALLSGRAFFLAAAGWGIGLAALSIAWLGWPIHAVFLDQMFSGAARSTAWMYNSAITVVFENLRMLSEPGATAYTRPPALEAAVQGVRLALFGLFGWLGWRARALPAPARWHALFVLSVFFLLLAGPVVWEHYLALLFVPLSYLLALREQLARGARLALWGVFGSAVGQNLVLVMWLEANLAIDSAPELIAAGLLKGAPLILCVVILARRDGGLLSTYRDAGWSGISPAPARGTG